MCCDGLTAPRTRAVCALLLMWFAAVARRRNQHKAARLREALAKLPVSEALAGPDAYDKYCQVRGRGRAQDEVMAVSQIWS